MGNYKELKDEINNINKYINKNKKKDKKTKNDFNKALDLLEIGIISDIAEIMVKNPKGRDKSEERKNNKKIIEDFLKKEIIDSYNLSDFDYEQFLTKINLYIYGLENSLLYFRTPTSLFKKDITLSLMLLRNIIKSFIEINDNDKNLINKYISVDILNLVSDINLNDNEEKDDDIVSIISSKSGISEKYETILRDKQMLEHEKEVLENDKRSLENKIKEILIENEKLKKNNKILNEKYKLINKMK
jgi:hypothetical protein